MLLLLLLFYAVALCCCSMKMSAPNCSVKVPSHETMNRTLVWRSGWRGRILARCQTGISEVAVGSSDTRSGLARHRAGRGATPDVTFNREISRLLHGLAGRGWKATYCPARDGGPTGFEPVFTVRHALTSQ